MLSTMSPLRSVMPRAHAAQLLERVEIAVPVQQRVATIYAERGNQHVDRAADGGSGSAEIAIVPRSSERQSSTACRFDAQAFHQRLRFPMVALFPKATQNLDENQVGHHDAHLPAPQQLVE